MNPAKSRQRGLLLFLCALHVSGVVGSRSQCEETPGQKSPVPLAVLHFENRNPGNGQDWLEKGLADMLITDLSQSDRLLVVERDRMALALEEISLSERGVTDSRDAKSVARICKVDWVLFGSYATKAGNIQIEVHLVEADTGRLLRVETVEGIFADLFALEKKLARRILSRLDVPLTEEERKRIERLPTSSLSALEHYYRGVDYADDGFFHDALLEFRLAHKTDTNYLKAWEAVGGAYRCVNEFEHAIVEYERLLGKHPTCERAAWIWHQVGVIQKKHLGGHPEALEAFDKALARFPEASLSVPELRERFMGARKEAIARRTYAGVTRFRSFWKGKGVFFDALMQRGICLLKLGRGVEAYDTLLRSWYFKEWAGAYGNNTFSASPDALTALYAKLRREEPSADLDDPPGLIEISAEETFLGGVEFKKKYEPYAWVRQGAVYYYLIPAIGRSFKSVYLYDNFDPPYPQVRFSRVPKLGTISVKGDVEYKGKQYLSHTTFAEDVDYLILNVGRTGYHVGRTGPSEMNKHWRMALLLREKNSPLPASEGENKDELGFAPFLQFAAHPSTRHPSVSSGNSPWKYIAAPTFPKSTVFQGPHSTSLIQGKTGRYYLATIRQESKFERETDLFITTSDNLKDWTLPKRLAASTENFEKRPHLCRLADGGVGLLWIVYRQENNLNSLCFSRLLSDDTWLFPVTVCPKTLWSTTPQFAGDYRSPFNILSLGSRFVSANGRDWKKAESCVVDVHYREKVGTLMTDYAPFREIYPSMQRDEAGVWWMLRNYGPRKYSLCSSKDLVNWKHHTTMPIRPGKTARSFKVFQYLLTPSGKHVVFYNTNGYQVPTGCYYQSWKPGEKWTQPLELDNDAGGLTGTIDRKGRIIVVFRGACLAICDEKMLP